MKTYSDSEIKKTGNTIIFLIERIPDLSKTKLLKLLYLAEEYFVKKYNLPFLGLEYEVWQAGPVPRDLFIELSDEPILLKDFIELKKTDEATFIIKKAKFSDDEFSDKELEMLDMIADKFGKKSAADLVALTLRKNSNWYHIASEKKLLPLFENGLANSSDEKIDFTWYIDKKGKNIYSEQKSFNKLVSFVNS